MGIQRLQSLTRDKKKRDFFIYGVGQAFNLISPLLVVPHIVAVCGEEGLGKAGMGFALSLFLILVVDYAFEIKGTKEVAAHYQDKAALHRIFNTTLFAKTFLFCITVVITVVLVYGIPFFSAEKKLFLFSLSIVLAQVFNPVWFLQGMENFRLASLINIGSKILYVVSVYLLVVQEKDYILVNLLLGLATLVFNLAGLLFIQMHYGIRIMKPATSEIKAILKADFSFCISQLFLSARQLSPLVLTGYFLGFYIAGQYKIIEQVITLFRTFVQVFLRFFYPQVCYKASVSAAAGFAFWKKYSIVNMLLVIASLAVIFVFSNELLEFFNASPATIADIQYLFRAALVLPLLMAISLPLEQLMFVADKNKSYVRITIAVTLINISFITLFINTHGIMGILITLIIAEILFIVLYFKNAFLFLKRQAGKLP